LSYQLPHAVALTNPTFKPDSLAISLGWHSQKTESFAAGRAKPSLFAPHKSIMHRPINSTPVAEFFYSSLKLLRYIPGKYINYNQIQIIYQYFLSIMPIVRVLS
jgi:hypothetical protein